jgi:hypothetical protein
MMRWFAGRRRPIRQTGGEFQRVRTHHGLAFAWRKLLGVRTMSMITLVLNFVRS